MMIRSEFNTYDDDTFYFLYVTENLRVETDGNNGLQIEIRDNYEIKPIDMYYYRSLKNDEAAYFQLGLLNPELDTTIKAVNLLFAHLEDELIDGLQNNQS